MSETPLYSALCALAGQNRLRFHMPGHKGNALYRDAFRDAARLDFTELPQTGNLYEGDGPIRDAERLAASFFGAEHCSFLTGGATQGIMAAMFLSCREGDSVLIDRGCHRSVTNACGLLGVNPVYIYPERLSGFSACESIAERAVSEMLKQNEKVTAVVVTSPTYYGATADVGAIGRVVRESGKKLIVDEAHGAHFPALHIKNAMQSGADLAVCSAHKTAPALGQGAYLPCKRLFAGGNPPCVLNFRGPPARLT